MAQIRSEVYRDKKLHEIRDRFGLLTHAPCLAIILKIFALDIVPFSLHEAELLLSQLNLEGTRLINRSISGCICQRVGFIQSPQKVKGNEARLQHGVQCLLGSSIILVQILQYNLEMLALGIVTLLCLSLALLDCDLHVLQILAQFAEIFEV